MNDLSTVPQLTCGQNGTRTKSPVPSNPILWLSYRNTFWKRVGCKPIKKLIKHLAGLWTILRVFLTFIFLLDIVGKSRQLLRAEPGFIYNPCSWNSWIHHLFRGRNFANESEGCKSVQMAFKPPLLPCCQMWTNTLEVIWRWLRGNVKGFDPCFLKHWRILWSWTSWTTRLEISWEKVDFFSRHTCW